MLLGHAAGSSTNGLPTTHNATRFGLGLLALMVVTLLTRKFRARRQAPAADEQVTTSSRSRLSRDLP